MPSPWHFHKPAYQTVGKKTSIKAAGHKQQKNKTGSAHSSFLQFLRAGKLRAVWGFSKQVCAVVGDNFAFYPSQIGDKSGIKLAWYAARA